MHYPCAGSSVAAGQGIRAAAHCPRQAGVRFTDLSTSTCNLNMGAPLAPDDSISSPVRAVRPACTWRDPCSDDSPVASSRAAHVGSCSVERNLAAARASVCSPRTSRRASGRAARRSAIERGGERRRRSGRSGRGLHVPAKRLANGEERRLAVFLLSHDELAWARSGLLRACYVLIMQGVGLSCALSWCQRQCCSQLVATYSVVHNFVFTLPNFYLYFIYMCKYHNFKSLTKVTVTAFSGLNATAAALSSSRSRLFK